MKITSLNAKQLAQFVILACLSSAMAAPVQSDQVSLVKRGVFGNVLKGVMGAMGGGDGGGGQAPAAGGPTNTVTGNQVTDVHNNVVVNAGGSSPPAQAPAQAPPPQLYPGFPPTRNFVPPPMDVYGGYPPVMGQGRPTPMIGRSPNAYPRRLVAPPQGEGYLTHQGGGYPTQNLQQQDGDNQQQVDDEQ